MGMEVDRMEPRGPLNLYRRQYFSISYSSLTLNDLIFQASGQIEMQLSSWGEEIYWASLRLISQYPSGPMGWVAQLSKSFWMFLKCCFQHWNGFLLDINKMYTKLENLQLIRSEKSTTSWYQFWIILSYIFNQIQQKIDCASKSNMVQRGNITLLTLTLSVRGTASNSNGE